MNDRSYRCDGCQSVVSINEFSRSITLDQVREVHESTCPGLRRGRRNPNQEGTHE